MIRLVLSETWFQSALRRLSVDPNRPVFTPLRVNALDARMELLAVPNHVHGGKLLEISWSQADLQATRPQRPNTMASARLRIGAGELRGFANGNWGDDGALAAAINELRLVGAGMHTIQLSKASESTRAKMASLRHPEDLVRWSRTMGAIGEDAWDRLVGLDYALIGLGRTGSGIASALARLGTRRLFLVDGDTVELHNLGESETITTADLGHTKATALASRLTTAHPRLEAIAIPHSITQLPALEAIRRSDLVIYAVDHDAARLAASLLAVLLLRPMVDLGTRIGIRPGPNMTGDVRLILPGRCILCFGGVSNEQLGRHVLSSASAEHTTYSIRDWRQERPGSLASLNHLALFLGLRMVEDLVIGRIEQSLWAHFEFDNQGLLHTEYPSANAPARGCFCQFAGLGSSGLKAALAFLRQIPNS